MKRQSSKYGWLVVPAALIVVLCTCSQVPGDSISDHDPVVETYMPVVGVDFEAMMQKDVEAKPQVMMRQKNLLEERYDLRDRPADGVMMSAGRKAVQRACA